MGAKPQKELPPAAAEFMRLAQKLSRDPRVDPPDVAKAKGFGSKGVKVARKMFAFQSKGRLVLKLPKERVDALVSSRKGKYFDPGHGRLMKEWVAIEWSEKQSWPTLANEALEHAASAVKPKRSRRTHE